MLYKKNTKTSVVFMTDEDAKKVVLSALVKSLKGDYEVKYIEEHFVAAAEVFFGKVPAAERQKFVTEIHDTFDNISKSLGEE